MSDNNFSKQEIRLFAMIAESLCDYKNNDKEELAEAEMQELIKLAAEESVLSMVCARLKREKLSGEDAAYVDMTAKQTASDFWQFMFIARDTLRILSQGGVTAVLLKGASVARFYPVPEARKATDVDVLLTDPGDEEQAVKILRAAGYSDAVHTNINHHSEWMTPDGRVLELHTMAVEPLDDKNFNRYVQERFVLNADDMVQEKVFGINLPMLSDGLLAFHLLLHMLMHFLRSGFGLKLLCDWVVFWNRQVDHGEIELFLKDVESCGLSKFMAAVTSVCIRYLGLSVDGTGALRMEDGKVCYTKGIFCEFVSEELGDEFMREIIEAGKNRKKDTERMVALRGNSLFDYVREFHHQTVLSFPKASRLIVTLPVLYIIAFYRFMRNNRTVRGGQSAIGILRKAGQRSSLVKKLL